MYCVFNCETVMVNMYYQEIGKKKLNDPVLSSNIDLIKNNKMTQ